MPYSGPRCGGPIQRGHSTGAHMAAGLAGGLFDAAFGAFHCRSWGTVPQTECSVDDQASMATDSVMMVGGRLAFLVVEQCVGTRRPVTVAY